MIHHRLIVGGVVLLGTLVAGTSAAQVTLKSKAEIERARVELEARRDIAPPDDLAKPPSDATRHDSGLISRRLSRGTGDAPAGVNDKVELHYTGWREDGAVIDTTIERSKPRSARVSQFIAGFSEGLTLMVVGERRRLWVPEELGYGGAEGKPAGTLVFDVELVSILRAPETPPDVAGVPDDAEVTESGLGYKVLRPGRGGARPGPGSMVLVESTSWRTDGTLYDSTVLDGEPITFNLDLTVPGFAEAFQMMTAGARWRLWMPPELANLPDSYRINEPMVFDVELLQFFAEPVTPPDVRAIPPDAVVTEFGVAYKVLRAGEGTRHPVYEDTVEVIYAGWTADGKSFDSSYVHGQSGVFTLDQRMPMGWNYALQQMVEGEKRRIWIPEELAYGKRKDRPQGMLIFEVELLSILDSPPAR
jgi:FKBP-type peptidyl-prolyl cis-trans isomerase